MSRYVVTELEGWDIRPVVKEQGRRPGLSVHVLDTAWNRRVVATFRSESKAGLVNATLVQRRAASRERAAALAARLNREDALARVRARGG